MSRITKRFGDLVAVQDVDISVARGEVHAIVGENGAGKSTLMRVLAGQFPADDGTIVLDGTTTAAAVDVRGRRLGIGFVEQEGGLIGELTGAENLILAERRGLWANRKEAGDRIRALAGKFGGNIDPDVPVQTLPMGQRQRLEILTTFAQGAGILILDEPTASLAIEDAKILGATIRRFLGDGGSVFYISHKLNEVKEIANTITVMRRGAVVGRHASKAVSVGALAAEMVGETIVLGASAGCDAAGSLADIAMGSRAALRRPSGGRQVCSLRNVSAPSHYGSDSGLADVSLTVHEGEIVGVAGVVGSGQTTLAEIMVGTAAPQAGTIERGEGAIAYVPENRHRDAVALGLTIRDNLMVHFHRREEFASRLWFRQGAIDSHVSTLLDASRVQGASRDSPVSSLSGGNQQKLVLGRELEQRPALIVAHNPYRGLDVRATRDVREAIVGACSSGTGVVMISSDLDDIFQLSHRIVVLFAGRIVGEVDAGPENFETVGRWLGGVS